MKKTFKLFCILIVLLLLAGCAAEDVPTKEPSQQGPQLNQQLSGPLSLGDKMPELTVTTAEGETLLLSELLQTKKMVVLNFWYADCIWCVREFPVMEAAYQQYREDVEILALNPFDAAGNIVAFRQEHSLSFPMAGCSRDLIMAFGVSGFPTSVVIDRNGTICLIHSGAITEKFVFDRLFEIFTAEEYSSKIYNSISQIF
jgi:peroxiredoxin